MSEVQEKKELKKQEPALSMQHHNGDQVVVIDVETSGFIPGYHEILQVAFLPLNARLDIRTDVMPLVMYLRPEHPERISKDALKKNKINIEMVLKYGIDPLMAADRLVEWIKDLRIINNKYGNPHKIRPLGHNYSFDLAFMRDWLGTELYDDNFNYHHSDTMIAANFVNDASSFQVQPIKYPKVNLKYLATTLGVPLDNAHDALADCVATAKIYKRMCMYAILGT